MATFAFNPYKVSAVYRLHLSQGAQWAERGGWRLPESFARPEEEAERVRRGAGLQDVSDIGKLDLKGWEVERFLASFIFPQNATAHRLRPDHVLLLTPPGGEEELAEDLLEALGKSSGCAHLTDVTSALSAFALVGVRAGEVLSRLTSLDVRPQAFPDGACAGTGLAKVHALLFRKDWARLPAYRILISRELGEYVWEVIQKAGENLNLAPFGLAAERLLGAEA